MHLLYDCQLHNYQFGMMGFHQATGLRVNIHVSGCNRAQYTQTHSICPYYSLIFQNIERFNAFEGILLLLFCIIALGLPNITRLI